MKEHTSLELSKRLHEKGFRGEHESAWKEADSQCWEDPSEYIPIITRNLFPDWGMNYIPAYTFTELWAVVPYMLHIDGQGYELLIAKDISLSDGPLSEAIYRLNGEEQELVNVAHESPTEALGLLVEWLIDEGRIQCDKEDEG
jgi:hypothetical protein